MMSIETLLLKLQGGIAEDDDDQALINWMIESVANLLSRVDALEGRDNLNVLVTPERFSSSKEAATLLKAAVVGKKNIATYADHETARKVQSAMSVYGVKAFGRGNVVTKLNGCELVFAVLTGD